VNAALEARRRPASSSTTPPCGSGIARDTPIDDALAIIAEAIVEELATGRPERLRVCANDRAVGPSRQLATGRRRWCDMRSCGNQAKAARYRAPQGISDRPRTRPRASPDQN